MLSIPFSCRHPPRCGSVNVKIVDRTHGIFWWKDFNIGIALQLFSCACRKVMESTIFEVNWLKTGFGGKVDGN